MRKNPPLYFLCLCALSLALLSPGAFALAQTQSRAAQPKTVLDFYLRLPSDAFHNYPLGDDPKAREAAITVRDLKNGYIRLGTPGEGESATVVLFKKPDASYLIMLETTLCALKCEQSLETFRYENGRWYDDPAGAFPKIDDRAARARVERETKAAKIIGPDNYEYQLLYELPRTGTTINVTENWSNKKVAELQWVNGKFIVKQARGK